MKQLLKEIRHNPLLWLLAFVPVVLAAAKLKPEAHTLLFVLSVLAIVPLAALLSHATESVAAKTGDAVGGLLNATLGTCLQDSRFNSFANDEVVISTSNNGGANWSAPTLVSVHTGQPAFDPSVYVNAAGVVGVSYFQWPSTVSGNEPTNLLIRHSTSPGSSAAGPAFNGANVLDGPFNNLAAPYAGGYFLGDYMGLVANASGFIPFYVKTNCSDGNATTQPSCRPIQSVLATPTYSDKEQLHRRVRSVWRVIPTATAVAG